MDEVEEGDTLAEGVRVRRPVRVEAILCELPAGSAIAAVDEEAILPAYQALARAGVHVEPTSALVWAALSGERSLLNFPPPIVLIMSGAGLKYTHV
jgi:threonine synthase